MHMSASLQKGIFLVSINSVSGPVGDYAQITQIYAPGSAGFQSDTFLKIPGLKPFSPEWLLFYQKNVPLVGRTAELNALNGFLTDERPFLWWCIAGPGGTGKSRLAHELLADLPKGYVGYFLSARSVLASAASNWTTNSSTVWVIDYAATSSAELTHVITILANRFSDARLKIRLLLIEREAAAGSPWWNSLFLRAGRNSAAMKEYLFQAPMPVPALGSQTFELLEKVLVAAGMPAPEAAAARAKVDEKALLEMTDGGRPLLTALAAARIFVGGQSASRLAPLDLIDNYLGRELRLWREQASNEEQFDALCYVAFMATLVAGLPLIRPRDRVSAVDSAANPVDIDAAQLEEKAAQHNTAICTAISRAVTYPDVEVCLRKLHQAGVSEDRRWSLQPDALGERLIQVMTCRPRNADEHYSSFPFYDAQRLAHAIFYAGHMESGCAAVLARLPDADVIRVLGLLATHPKATMRAVLIQMRLVAALRGAALPPAYLAILDKARFQERYQDDIRLAAECLYDASIDGAVTTAQLSRLMSDPAASKHAIWLLPFMAVIGHASSEQRYQLISFYSSVVETTVFDRTRELVLALTFLFDCATAIIAATKTALGESEGAMPDFDGIVPASVLDSFQHALRTLMVNAGNMAARVSPEDREELMGSVGLTSVQASYIFLNAGHLADAPVRDTWLAYSAEFALNGLQLCGKEMDDNSATLCRRNAIAALHALRPDEPHVAAMRTSMMASYREQDARSSYMDLALDAAKAYASQGNEEGFGAIMSLINEHAHWLGEHVYAAADEGGHYLHAINELVSANRHDSALRISHAYGVLILSADLSNGYPALQSMFGAIAAHVEHDSSPLIATLVSFITSLYDAAPNTKNGRLVLGLLAHVSMAMNADGPNSLAHAISHESIGIPARTLNKLMSMVGSGSGPALTFDSDLLEFTGAPDTRLAPYSVFFLGLRDDGDGDDDAELAGVAETAWNAVLPKLISLRKRCASLTELGTRLASL